MTVEIMPGKIRCFHRRWQAGVLFLFVCVLSFSIAPAEARIEAKKNVLILNSYHEGFKWTDDITRGVIAALEPVRGETRIFIEYLNTKWVKDDVYFQQVRRILRHKYARTRFDLIISSDNDAFDFLRDYRDEVFGKVPVVFSGVNYFQQSDLAGTTLFTGVGETADLRESLELALRLHPSVKRIFVINDLGISGRLVKDELDKLAPSFHGRARIEYENSVDLEKILKDVESLSPDTLIFYTFFFGDPARISYENSECISLIQRHARVPIYGAWDFNLGYGIVGGKLTSGYDQGITSGRLGLRILKGERVGNLPPILRSRTRYMFDYRQMARFGIRKSALPEGSIVINGPKTFSEIPNALIWATLCGIASLGAVIFMLLYANRQRKRSEEALQKAYAGLEQRVEERTAELAETVRALRFTQFAVDRSVYQAFWLTSDGRFFYVNDAACDSLGYTRDELLTMSVPEINPTCSPDEFPPYWRMLLEKGTYTFETSHRARDGRVFPVEIRANLLAFDGKEYCCCFVTDINERKRAEEALRDSEARMKMAMDLARLVQWEYDVESCMFTFDDQFYALYCTTAEQEGGVLMSAEDYARRFIPPEESSLVAGGITEVLAKSSNQLEHRIIRADGEERHIVVRGEAVRNETGRIVKIRGVNQDITERRCAEELLRKSAIAQRKLARELAQKNSFLRTLIDAIPDLIFYKDCNRAYLGCNKAFEAFAGLPEKDLVGRTDLDIFNRDVAVSFRETDLEILSTDESRRSEEWIDYPDGRRTLQETLKTPYFNLDGEILGVVGVSRDITERRLAEEALRESESRVRRKLESILDPEGDTGELDLADILDAPQIQALMEDIHRITGLKMSIIDVKGRVLVDVGWQDICRKFHRSHPDTLKRCLESDTDLTLGIPKGEFRTYRCKNNMWHIVTPIIVGERHMGNLFMGQFFFADEEIDYDLFRLQARTFGFPEEEYMAALETVPRHGEEFVNLGKGIFLQLTDMFSKLSYANIKLAHSLADRDRLTETLREANLVVENSPAVLFRWKVDDVWPVELVSGNVTRFGYTPDDFLSGTLTYSEIIHADDLERVTREVHEYCDGGVDQFRLEYRILTKGRDVRWVNEHTRVERDAAGGVRNFEGIVIDTTDRKLAEDYIRESRAKYQAIVDSFDGLIYVSSRDNRVEFMNRKLIERTGRDAVGEYCYQVMHDLDSVCPWCLNDRVFAGEIFHRDMFSPKDGRWYEVLNVPIRHADGSMSKHAMMIDITDRKRFEEELQRQKQMLQELNDTLEKRVTEEVARNRGKDIMLIQQNRQAALGEMLDHIAHQWKQPITSLSLVIQELGETSSCGELTEEHVREAVSISMAILDHMIQTMNVFRGFYRPDKERKVFNIKDSIDQALAFISPAFRFQSIAVELDVDPGLTVFGYPMEYAQVLLNILANARDIFRARETGNPRVIIRAFAERNKTVVTITDNAGGIPESIMDKIFDFYFTTNEAGGGTGIGLYMSRNIIEKNMGGRLLAENTEGGALFRIETFPT